MYRSTGNTHGSTPPGTWYLVPGVKLMSGYYSFSYCTGRPGGVVVTLECCYKLLLIALILESESRRGEILDVFAKKEERDELLRAPSVGRCN